VAHVAADFALKPQRLFFGRFREYSLKRVFLSAVTAFFSRVVTFSFGKGSTFSSLVEAYGVSLMFLALWAVRSDFFGNIHVVRFPACNRENIGHSYTFSAFDAGCCVLKYVGTVYPPPFFKG
jgi:hypothetical protein